MSLFRKYLFQTDEIHTIFSLYETEKDRKQIKLEWIEQAVNDPVKTHIQSDGRIKKWAYINEAEKYLRVILLEDGLTIHNAFFDGRFKESEDENQIF